MTTCSEFISEKLPSSPDNNIVYQGGAEQYLRLYCVGYETEDDLCNASSVLTTVVPENIQAICNEFSVGSKLASFAVQTSCLHHVEGVTIADLMMHFSLCSFEDLINELSDAMKFRSPKYVGINFISEGIVFIKRPYLGRISRNSFIVE